MKNHTQLTKFKKIFEESKKFLNSNWKKIVYYFLPVQIIILVTAVVLDVLPRQTDSSILVIVGIIASLLSFLALISIKILSTGAPLILKDIDDNNHSKNIHWYKNVLKKISGIVWIGALVSLLNITFISLIGFMAVMVFIAPSIVVGILLRIGLVDFAFYFQDIFVNNTMVGITLSVLFVGSVISSIAFLINSYFSMYAFLLEGRRGLDAIATSFMTVTKRRTKIFWRILCVWVVSLIPFLILLLPVQGKIIYDSLRGMAIQVFLLQVPPALPDIPVGTLLARDILSFIASVISVPIAVVLNYFLWKEVNATAQIFEESKYNKTRKWIKIGVWAGLVILVSIMVIATISVMSFKAGAIL